MPDEPTVQTLFLTEKATKPMAHRHPFVLLGPAGALAALRALGFRTFAPTVDERYHVEKATRAACAYLTEAHARFGSWVLAAASYNMGRTGVAKALDAQQVSTYWDLHLNSETARYVYRLLALREVMESPEMYGFHLGRQDVYAPLDCRTVNVSSDIANLAEFALSEGTTLRELKAINPWLRDTHLQVPEGKSYAVSVPA